MMYLTKTCIFSSFFLGGGLSIGQFFQDFYFLKILQKFITGSGMMRKTIMFLSNRKRELIIESHLQCIFPENRLVQNIMHVSLSIHDQNNPAYKVHA